ncbi:MAG: hypothetical protein PHP01_09705 [Phycisphaerae bacterium]|nr:hypothetical protein [Phycisphaerae bacterium]
MEQNELIRSFEVYFAELQKKKSFIKLFFEIDKHILSEAVKSTLSEWKKTATKAEQENTGLSDFFLLQIIVGLIKMKFVSGADPARANRLIYKLLEYHFQLDEGRIKDNKLHYKIENYLNNGRLLFRNRIRAEYHSDPHGHQLSVLQLIIDDLNLKYGSSAKKYLNKAYLEFGNTSIVFNNCDLYFKLFKIKLGDDGKLVDADENAGEIEQKSGTRPFQQTDDSDERVSLIKLALLFLPVDDREIILLRFGFPHGSAAMAHEAIAKLKKLVSTGDYTSTGVIRNMFLEAQAGLSGLIDTFNLQLNDSTKEDILDAYHEKVEEVVFTNAEEAWAYHDKHGILLRSGDSRFYFQMLAVARESMLKWFLVNRYPDISGEAINTCVMLFFKNLTPDERGVVCTEKFCRHTIETLAGHCENNRDLLQVLMPAIDHETVTLFAGGLRKLLPLRERSHDKWNRIKPKMQNKES